MRLFHAQNKTGISITGAVIVCDGNSFTYGTGATNPATNSYPALLDADNYFNGATFYNKGVPAQKTSDMIADASSDITPLYNGGVSCILVAWEVGNDIYFNGNAANAVATFWNYCDARKAEGWKVIVINCPPRDQSTSFGDNSAQYNAKLVTANGLLAAEWSSHADKFVDLAGDSRFSGYDLTYYDADKVHYTNAGYNIVYEQVKAKIQEL